MRFNAALSLLLATALLIPLACASQTTQMPVIIANDNRTPAGNLTHGGVLNLQLELRPARWYAEAPDGVYKEGYRQE